MALGLAPRRIAILVALGCCAALLVATSREDFASAAQRPCRGLPVKSTFYRDYEIDADGRRQPWFTVSSFCWAYRKGRRQHWGSEIFGALGHVNCSNFNDFDDGSFGARLRNPHRPHDIIRLGEPRKFHLHFRDVKDSSDPEAYATVDVTGRFRGQHGPAVGTVHYLGPL